uniref:Uncharacterized protein n=1 Tax=Cacopsylla melanoneura TaxID=428564 RepID=A0A8D9F798_9HEMI
MVKAAQAVRVTATLVLINQMETPIVIRKTAIQSHRATLGPLAIRKIFIPSFWKLRPSFPRLSSRVWKTTSICHRQKKKILTLMSRTTSWISCWLRTITRERMINILAKLTST